MLPLETLPWKPLGSFIFWAWIAHSPCLVLVEHLTINAVPSFTTIWCQKFGCTMHRVRGPRLGLVTRSRTGLHSPLTYHHTCRHASYHIGPNHVHETCYIQCNFHRGLQLCQLRKCICLVIYNKHRALLERMTKFQLAANSYSCTVMVVIFSFFQINAFFPRPFQTPLMKLCGHFTWMVSV